jgi:hypothetical protein
VLLRWLDTDEDALIDRGPFEAARRRRTALLDTDEEALIDRGPFEAVAVDARRC